MKYTTEEYTELLDGRLPCSSLEVELCDKLMDLQRELASNTEIIDNVSGTCYFCHNVNGEDAIIIAENIGEVFDKLDDITPNSEDVEVSGTSMTYYR